MKFSIILVSLLQFALASPVDLNENNEATINNGLETRLTQKEKLTNNIVFNINLEAFIKRRKNKNPSYLIWKTDGCTKAVDNPLGFPFEPACWRHDFGYNNFRKQKRLRKNGNRLKIDKNFRKDMFFQCKSVFLKKTCRALARVYYRAVRIGGDNGSKKRDVALDLAFRDETATNSTEISPEISSDELQTDPLYDEEDEDEDDNASTDEELQQAYEKALAAYYATRED